MEDVDTPRPWTRTQLWVLLLIPLAYYAGAVFGVRATVMPEGTAILWPPNSALLAGLLLLGFRSAFILVPLCLFAEVAADLPTFTLEQAVAFGTINAFEALLAYSLLRAVGFDRRLSTPADVRKFLVLAVGVAPLFSAIPGAAMYALLRDATVPYLEYVRVWWFGDALGLLVFTPLWLALAQGRQAWRRERPYRGSDWLVLALVPLSLVLLLASQAGRLGGLPFTPLLLLPVAIGVASRFPLPVVSVAVALLATTVLVVLTQGFHPFGTLSAQDAVLAAQEFVLIVAVVPLGLSALLSRLRHQRAQLMNTTARLAELNRDLEARVRERTASLDALNAEWQRQAMLDPLTGLANRRAFYQQAEAAFHERMRHKIPLALILIDIDHFKQVNDRHGHAVGDQVLRAVAMRMAAVSRPEDTLARYGGEEFAVIAQHVDLSGAERLAQRLWEVVRQSPVEIGDGRSLQVSISVGVAACRPDLCDLEELVRRADEALYRAKEGGRDAVVLAP